MLVSGTLIGSFRGRPLLGDSLESTCTRSKSCKCRWCRSAGSSTKLKAQHLGLTLACLSELPWWACSSSSSSSHSCRYCSSLRRAHGSTLPLPYMAPLAPTHPHLLEAFGLVPLCGRGRDSLEFSRFCRSTISYRTAHHSQQRSTWGPYRGAHGDLTEEHTGTLQRSTRGPYRGAHGDLTEEHTGTLQRSTRGPYRGAHGDLTEEHTGTLQRSTRGPYRGAHGDLTEEHTGTLQRSTRGPYLPALLVVLSTYGLFRDTLSQRV